MSELNEKNVKSVGMLLKVIHRILFSTFSLPVCSSVEISLITVETTESAFSEVALDISLIVYKTLCVTVGGDLSLVNMFIKAAVVLPLIETDIALDVCVVCTVTDLVVRSV